MAQWADLERPADIYIDANEIVYVSDLTPTVTIMDKQGNKIARRPGAPWAGQSRR
jgi:hypothetical protein